jgi:hypothetical protein
MLLCASSPLCTARRFVERLPTPLRKANRHPGLAGRHAHDEPDDLAGHHPRRPRSILRMQPQNSVQSSGRRMWSWLAPSLLSPLSLRTSKPYPPACSLLASTAFWPFTTSTLTGAASKALNKNSAAGACGLGLFPPPQRPSGRRSLISVVSDLSTIPLTRARPLPQKQ